MFLMGSSLTPTPLRGHLNSLERRGAKAQPPDEDVSGRKRPLHRERESPLRCIPRSGLFHVWNLARCQHYGPVIPGNAGIQIRLGCGVSGFGAQSSLVDFMIWIPVLARMSGMTGAKLNMRKRPEHFCPGLFRSQMNRILPDANAVRRGEVVFRTRLDVEGLVPGVRVAQRADDAERGGGVRVGGDLLLLRLFAHLRLPDL